MWNKKIINFHIEANKLLDRIKDEAFDYIRLNKNVSEKDVQNFIVKKFKENNLKHDKDPPIVAFNENSVKPHYFPLEDSKIIKENSLILIDLWAKFKDSKSPFGDITWMAYYGDEVPSKIQRVFDIVMKSRGYALDFIKSELDKGKIPSGKEIDKVVRDYIYDNGFEGKFIHGTGHCIGFTSPHGNRGNINSKGKQHLLTNIGYTIEPGIYLEGEFGVRSEINFLINSNLKLIVTSKVQKEIVKI